MRDEILEQLRAVYGGRKWLLTTDALAGLTRMAARLHSLGATDVFCIANGTGTGDLPECGYAVLGGAGAGSIMESTRLALEALGNLPPHVQAQVDAWDPDRRAACIGPIWDNGEPVAGRQKFAARRTAWQALEDKMIVDAFWDDAGIPRAPCAVVPVKQARDVSQGLDWGAGVAWVGDNKEGWHGGAEYLRWVRSDADAAEAEAFLAARCDEVRVMPFLEGVPCSIHGIVMDAGVVAVRPCEMIVLRRPGKSQLHYARAGTFWDPPAEDRAAMIAAVRSAGALLHERVDYRGVFTVDGIMTSRGFLPTELNPRYGGALATVARGAELPLLLLHMAIVAGLELPPSRLEPWLVKLADEQRSASGMSMIEHAVEARSAFLTLADGDPAQASSWSFTEDEAAADASVSLGPSTMGGYLNVSLSPERTPVGPSSAPRVAGALQFLDEVWALGIGPLEPAPDVR